MEISEENNIENEENIVSLHKNRVENVIKKYNKKHTRTKRITVVDDIMEYIVQIENGVPFEEALEESGMVVSKFKRELFYNGGERGKAILLKRLEEEIPMLPDIIKGHKNNKTIRELAQELNTTTRNIMDAIEMYRLLKEDRKVDSKDIGDR